MKNMRTAIIREIPVKHNWDKYKCHIVSRHITYELALKAEKEVVASSESETEFRFGKRKIKPDKLEDYVEYPGPPRLVLSSKNLDNLSSSGEEESSQTVVFNNVKHTDGLSGESSETIISENIDKHTDSSNVDEYTDSNNIDEHTDENVILTKTNINDIPIIIEGENNNLLIIINNLQRMMKSVHTEIESMKEKQEKSLLQIQETTTVILSKINSAQYYKEDTVIRDDKIGKYLPLTSIENFLELENILKDDQDAFMQVVNKVLLIGGKNERDFIKRTLVTMFTDNLASICSWTGQKNNFKIGDTHTMMAIKKAFRAAYPRNTDKEFEHSVMEWFRFANVRKQKKGFSKSK